MADKINAIKIKQSNGSYSDQIPISVLVQNVQWDQDHSLLDALGSVDLSSSGKGNLQHQIDELDEDKISHDDFNSQLDEFLSQQIKEDTETWLEENINPGEGFGITTNLTLSGWAADAKAVGDAIDAKTFPIDSTLSDSSTNPVQNKVVTSAISELNGSLEMITGSEIDLYSYTSIPYSINNQNKWNGPSGYRSILIPIADLKEEINLYAKTDNLIYAFLKTDNSSSVGSTPDYCNGYGGMITIPSGSSSESVEVPDDCGYLYLSTGSNDSRLGKISISTPSDLSLKVKDIDKDVDVLKSVTNGQEIDLSHYKLIPWSISNNNTWNNLSNYPSVFIPVKDLSRSVSFYAESDIIIYAFLKSDTTIANASPDFCDNTFVVRLAVGTEKKFVRVPSDCKYLCVSAGQNGSRIGLIKVFNDAITSGYKEKSPVLPVLKLYGDVSEMSADIRSNLRYAWVDIEKHEHRTGWLDAKWQGNSSLANPKKNYTFRFYEDSSHKRKDKINFFELTTQSKWVAKANYMDHSHARNIVSARLWADVVKTRKSSGIPELIKSSPNLGAINGYPIVIYLNDEYLGLYTLNIPKDDFLFGMDEDNPLHCCAYGEYGNGGDKTKQDGHILSCEFRYASTVGWSCEVPGTFTGDTQTSLVNLINFVMTSTDEEFYTNLNNYLNVDSAIDYYLFCYFIGAMDSLAKNMILLTYDGGVKWYCSAYDLDSTFGIWWDGSVFKNYNMACPEEYGDNNSLLWERIEQCFGNELYSRYLELRETVFNVDYVCGAFDIFEDMIPQKEYDADVAKWKQIPQKDADHFTQIKTWITARAPYVDAEIAALATE